MGACLVLLGATEPVSVKKNFISIRILTKKKQKKKQ